MTVSDFDNLVENNLISCGVHFEENKAPELKIGAAVSGGADSISLLVSLSHILQKKKASLFVVSVNHNIREKNVSLGDSLYVEEVCRKLSTENFKIVFERVDIPEGKVFEVEKNRGNGTEEAARFLRYEIFNSFAKKYNLDFLCLAHNQNDQLETLLMRFLQGSDFVKGIEQKRDFFIRPLINIERNQIEEYLKLQKIEWRTDATNFDDAYFRNKIRLHLIPFLNDNFEGWKTALLKNGEKSRKNQEVISELVQSFPYSFKENKVVLNRKDFLNQFEYIQEKLLIKFFNILGYTDRLPYNFIKDLNSFIKQCENGKKLFNNYVINSKNNTISIEFNTKSQTDLYFFDIIEEEGIYDFPCGKLTVSKNVNKLFDLQFENFFLKDVHLPLCVRNAQTGDVILTKNRTFKNVSEIFSDWKVPVGKRSLIPLIQELQTENQEITAIAGSVLGFENWIV